jgi:6-phosphogluconate dehydrogenase
MRYISTSVSQTVDSLIQKCDKNDVIFAGGNGEYVGILNNF